MDLRDLIDREHGCRKKPLRVLDMAAADFRQHTTAIRYCLEEDGPSRIQISHCPRREWRAGHYQ
jgi:hypothetical protein